MTTITSSTSPAKSSMTASLISLPGGYAASPRPAPAAPAYLQPLPLPVPAPTPTPAPDHHAHAYAQDRERARSAYTHFKKLLRYYLQVIDLQQQDLAKHLGLQPRVLNRKLNLTQKAFLNPAETKRLVLKLAELEAITYQWQAIELLQTLYPDQNFKQNEWRTPPLNYLEGPKERPVQYPPAYPAEGQTEPKKRARQVAHANPASAKASPSVTQATPTATTVTIEKPGLERATPLSWKQLHYSQLNPQAIGEFGRKLRNYASLINFNQKGLANAIGMHSTTFGRRFKTTTSCPFSQEEVKQLIEVLAREGAISAVWQARELLQLLYPDSDFTKKELALPPLSKLSLLPSDNRQAGSGRQSMSGIGEPPAGARLAAKHRPSAGPGIRAIGPVLDSEESRAITDNQAEAANSLPSQAQAGQHGSQYANAQSSATGPGQLDQMLMPLATQLAQLLTGLVSPLAAITATATTAAPGANTTNSMNMSNQSVVMSALPAPVAGQPATSPQIAVLLVVVNQLNQ